MEIPQEQLDEAMDAVTRLYDLRETYARTKEELNRIEREMHDLHRKVWSTIRQIQTTTETNN